MKEIRLSKALVLAFKLRDKAQRRAWSVFDLHVCPGEAWQPSAGMA